MPNQILPILFTSQSPVRAATLVALVEAIEASATTLLLDEDTSATNFMIRDERMQTLVAKAKEPITPFVDRVDELRNLGLSTVLVMGGSGDSLDHADTVIQMDGYRPVDVTAAARDIARDHPTGRRREHRGLLRSPWPRRLAARSIDPERAPGRVKVKARGRDGLVIGRSEIDLRAVEQLSDASQVRAIGWILSHLGRRHDAELEPRPAIAGMLRRIEAGDWDWPTGRPAGDPAAPRGHDVVAPPHQPRGHAR